MPWIPSIEIGIVVAGVVGLFLYSAVITVHTIRINEQLSKIIKILDKKEKPKENKEDEKEIRSIEDS